MNPPDPNNIRMKPELGGGALLDMGCYMISVARMLFAAEPVAGRGWWKQDKRFGVDVAAAGVLEFPRNAASAGELFVRRLRERLLSHHRP